MVDGMAEGTPEKVNGAITQLDTLGERGEKELLIKAAFESQNDAAKGDIRQNPNWSSIRDIGKLQ